jgi:protein-S-isoprenylcysteine O-methyltransferase Ste14
LYDILIASPIVSIYLSGVAVSLLPEMLGDVSRLPATDAWLDIANKMATIIYFAVIITAVIVRRVPVGSLSEVFPRALALIAVAMAVARPSLLHPAHLPPRFEAMTALLTVCGTVASIAVLLRLGRSFSILPEARALVTDGPYRIVRHPLYVAEEIGNIGIMLQYTQPWSLLLEIVNVGLQVWRMSYEERVLTQAFPEYATYAARTSRIIPGIY